MKPRMTNSQISKTFSPDVVILVLTVVISLGAASIWFVAAGPESVPPNQVSVISESAKKSGELAPPPVAPQQEADALEAGAQQIYEEVARQEPVTYRVMVRYLVRILRLLYWELQTPAFDVVRRFPRCRLECEPF